MKIEKLNENKIRVIINDEDLEENNLDIGMLLKKESEGKDFFFDLLQQAKEEVGFNADGCKILIEAFSGSEDNFIFTITKYNNSLAPIPNKPIPIKRKINKTPKKETNNTQTAIYKFLSFDEFCEFAKYIVDINDIDINKVSKKISLYLYNNIYYLTLKNINLEYEKTSNFFYIATEFSSLQNYSNNFENKLIEHGKLLIKKDAIQTASKYFK